MLSEAIKENKRVTILSLCNNKVGGCNLDNKDMEILANGLESNSTLSLIVLCNLHKMEIKWMKKDAISWHMACTNSLSIKE